MSNTLMTIEEVATLMRLTPYRVRKLCKAGAVPGANKIGRRWLIRSDVFWEHFKNINP